MTPIADPTAPILVGREAFLAAIHLTLHRDRTVAITGPGGIGKTAVAREYMRRFGSQYQHVLWLHAASAEVLLADCHDSMEQLGLTLANTPNISPIQPLRDWLAERRDYLLIIDGANDPAVVRSLLAQRYGGHVIQTQCSRDFYPPVVSHALTALSAEDGATLLLHQAALLPPTAAIEFAVADQRCAALAIADEVAGLPLVLAVAGATIRLSGWTPQEYLANYRERAHAKQNTPPTAMSTVGALACAAVTHQMPQAMAWLRTCAILAPTAIPIDLIVQTCNSGETANQSTGQKRAELDLLLTSQLVHYSSSPHLLYMHPLNQTAVRHQIAPLIKQQTQEQLLQAIHQQLSIYDTLSMGDCLRIVAQIQHIVAESEHWTFTTDEAAQVFLWATHVYLKNGERTAAIPLLKITYTIWDRIFGLEDSRVPTISRTLAELLRESGDFAAAERLLHQLIRLNAHEHGAKNADVIANLNSLGDVCADQGKLAEAEVAYQKALILCEQDLGTRHPLTILTQHNLATFYQDIGKLAEAGPLFRQISLHYVRTLGIAQPETAQALYEFAHHLLLREKWQAAQSLFVRVLDLYQQLPDETLNEKVACLHQLMLIAQHEHQDAEAIALAKQIVALREEQMRQPDTPATIVNIYSLAGVYIGMGKLDDAERLMQHALVICERFPELGLPATITGLNCLASLYRLQGKNATATATLEQALQAWEHVLEPDDPELTALRVEYHNQINELRH